MEYGEAVTTEAHERAVSIARELLGRMPVAKAAAEAVSRAYCVCATAGEDAAERRLSNLHRSLIEAVARRIATPGRFAGQES